MRSPKRHDSRSNHHQPQFTVNPIFDRLDVVDQKLCTAISAAHALDQLKGEVQPDPETAGSICWLSGEVLEALRAAKAELQPALSLAGGTLQAKQSAPPTLGDILAAVPMFTTAHYLALNDVVTRWKAEMQAAEREGAR